ncbi:hypothetical protein IAE30_29235 [Pantoea sp. S61]|nr:hypothetical protein [Pantoea sp. S61]
MSRILYFIVKVSQVWSVPGKVRHEEKYYVVNALRINLRKGIHLAHLKTLCALAERFLLFMPAFMMPVPVKFFDTLSISSFHKGEIFSTRQQLYHIGTPVTIMSTVTYQQL